MSRRRSRRDSRSDRLRVELTSPKCTIPAAALFAGGEPASLPLASSLGAPLDRPLTQILGAESQPDFFRRAPLLTHTVTPPPSPSAFAARLLPRRRAAERDGDEGGAGGGGAALAEALGAALAALEREAGGGGAGEPYRRAVLAAGYAAAQAGRMPMRLALSLIARQTAAAGEAGGSGSPLDIYGGIDVPQGEPGGQDDLAGGLSDLFPAASPPSSPRSERRGEDVRGASSSPPPTPSFDWTALLPQPGPQPPQAAAQAAEAAPQTAAAPEAAATVGVDVSSSASTAAGLAHGGRHDLHLQPAWLLQGRPGDMFA